MCYPDSRDSRGVYDVPLGLHPHLRNGGRSRVEITGEFHEGVVPLSTLLAIYRYRVDFCHLSVRYYSYLPIHTFFCSSNGSNFEGNRMSEDILR